MRLTLWNSIVVIAASLLALFAVREAMRVTILNEAKMLLQEEATELELAVKQFHPKQERINEEFARKILSHGQHNWFAALLDGEDLAWQSENFPDDWKSGSPSDVDRDFAFHENGQQIVVSHSLKTKNGTALTIVLGEPNQFIRDDIWQLTKVMLYIGAALLVIAPVGGFLLARQATSPVREIISTTRSLDPMHLNSRLPIRGTGDELDQISTEINSFVDQISRYIESQREFVANAAHELRSPITAIQTSVEVTLDKPRTIDVYQEELETVSEQCQHLRHLVNQLLELAESDANVNWISQAVNLKSLVQTSINVFSGVAEEKGIEIVSRLVDSSNVSGNESKLRQVFNNLLDNALKFSPTGGTVKVELIEKEGLIVLNVHDSGPGIPDDQLEKIFDRFFQIDQSRQRTSRRGNGLGLSICKSIIEQHLGTIEASNDSQGFFVCVHLPAADPLITET